MQFRPETLVHRVILKPKIQKKTESGIIISTDERSQAVNSDKGVVHMIGPMAWKAFGCDESPVKVGDEVFYARYGAKVLKDPDTDDLFVVCNDEDILVGYTS